jgi:uncharacterized protein YgbK (DUF1537 family)
MPLLIGVVADDLTGATDVALMLAREGMRVVQITGVPAGPAAIPEAEAVVVALKSRTIPAADAVAMSVASADALKAAGARQILFKYCSTFDSTDEGNIGPVTEALMQRLEAKVTIACPAFPENGRSVYQGHLFVGPVLLSDSPMKDHPLTPMHDANLCRVLARQTAYPVSLIPFNVVESGVDAVREKLAGLAGSGPAIAIADAVTNMHLRTLGAACADLPLITGGSGIALGLPENARRAGAWTPSAGAEIFSAPSGASAILAGSCSAATRGQVAHAIAAGVPALALDPLALSQGEVTPQSILAWARPRLAAGPVLIYSTADPDAVRSVQDRLGRDAAGALIERTHAEVAQGLVKSGVSRLVVAGGETSGAVVEGLGIRSLEIGPEIDPGVPWTRSLSAPVLALALKSGNFGAPDFFIKALKMLD